MTQFTAEMRDLAIKIVQSCNGMESDLVINALAIALGSSIGAHTIVPLDRALEYYIERVEAAARAHPRQSGVQHKQ